MTRFIICTSGVLIALFCRPGTARAADGQQDLAAETRAIFSAKCAVCHGPNLEKPKGRFGYVLDLARVANNREMIVPGSPDESELWELVRRGEMPPAESPAGPLNENQKEVIRRWIAAGAPAARPTETGVLPSTEALDDAPDRPALSVVTRRLGRLGARCRRFGR